MPNFSFENEIPRGTFFEIVNNFESGIFPINLDLEIIEDTISLLNFTIEKGVDYAYFRLLDKNEMLLSLLRLRKVNYCDNTFYQISKIGSKSKKKGFAKYLYNLAIRNLDYPIISDSSLTCTGSYYLWDSFIRNRKDGSYMVKVINLKDCSIFPFNSSYKKYYYWGCDLDMMEEIKGDIENLILMQNDGQLDDESYDFIYENLYKIEDKKHMRFILTYIPD